MGHYFTYEMKKIWQRRDLWFVLIASALIAVISFFHICMGPEPVYSETIVERMPMARMYNMLGGGGDLTLLMTLCLLPVFATIIAGTSYSEEKKAHMLPILLSRGKPSAYYRAKGIAITVTAFVGSTLPYFLSGLLGFLAAPIKETQPEMSTSLYARLADGQYWLPYSYEKDYILFPSLYLNSPILDFLAHVVLIGLYGIGLALLVYGISLFFHKSKIVLTLLPMILNFVAYILLISLKQWRYLVVSYFSLVPSPSQGLNAFQVLSILLSIILIDILLIIIGIKRNEDIL